MGTISRFSCLIILAIVLAAGLNGCSRSSPESQTGLSKEQMAHTLAEIHLAGARAGLTGESLDSLRAVAFAHADIDSLVFDQALEVWAQNPEAFLSLYERTIDLLQQERGELISPDSLEPTLN